MCPYSRALLLDFGYLVCSRNQPCKLDKLIRVFSRFLRNQHVRLCEKRQQTRLISSDFSPPRAQDVGQSMDGRSEMQSCPTESVVERMDNFAWSTLDGVASGTTNA